jgi:ribulose-5-phosphate 4-epimerase/fuculose-1-phosphate aldolase
MFHSGYIRGVAGTVTGSAESTEVRRAVVSACRVLLHAGQGDLVWGHVSIRDPHGRGVWMKGNNLGFDEVEEEDVILLSWDGEQLAGRAGRHIEYPIHTELMAAREEIQAVVHTHPVYSIAFAATGRPLPALSHDAAAFVPPDVPRFTVTGDLVSDKPLGQALSATLGDRPAVLMPNHGITTVGATLGTAVGAAIALERSCQIALLAGAGAVGSPDEEALVKQGRAPAKHEQAWEYLLRTMPSV